MVMDHNDYSSKLEAMLEDRDTYQPVAKDPTAALERKMNSVLLDLRRAGRLPGNTYYQLHSSAGQVPRLYGLPKVHKQDVPLRPIVSFVSSPTYQLSKFLTSLLSPIVGLSDHHVRNSQHFVQCVNTQKLRDIEVLVSFNVVSLFPRVPTTRAIQVTRERLLGDLSLSNRTLLSSVAQSHTLLPSLSGPFLSRVDTTPHDLPLPLALLRHFLYPSLLSVHLIIMCINVACTAGTYYAWYLTHPRSLLYISGGILLWHYTYQL